MSQIFETNLSIMVVENGFVVQRQFPHSTKRAITSIADTPEELSKLIHQHAEEVVYIYREIAAGRMSLDGKVIEP